MRNNQTFLITAAAAIAAIGLLLFTPRRTEAQYSSPVRVMNTTAEAVPVHDMQDSARQPFTLSFDPFIPQGQTNANVPSPPLPAGKRMVIELVYIEGRILTQADLQVTTAGQTREYHMPNIRPLGQQGYYTFQPLRLYADPSTSIVAAIGSNGGGGGRVTISGYLVDIP